MDMAVANLFKRKIRLTPSGEVRQQHEPESFILNQIFRSPRIENFERMDASLFKPFIIYAVSNIIHKHQDFPIDWEVDRFIQRRWEVGRDIRVNWQIDRVEILIQACESEDRGFHDLTLYRFENPFDYPELFFTRGDVDSFSFPEHLLTEPFFVWVRVRCYYSSNDVREAIERRFIEWGREIEEEYTPPPETYRQDCCVVCLESKPNILYLDCMHIAICDSCDRLKKTNRYNCDVCRAVISKRVKI